MKKPKRVLSLLIAFSVILTFSGCKRVNQVIEAINLDKEAERTAFAQAEIVLNCFKTGDTEELEAQFCENISSTHDLKAEIAAAIEYIDGNIIDDGTWIAMGTEREKVENNETTKLSIRPSLGYVTTDKGQEYKIIIYSFIVCKEDPSSVGMTRITVYKEDYKDKSYAEIGESIIY